MNNEAPVSDEQMGRCFGKSKNCGRNCRLKELCLDKYREQEEEKRRQRYREAHYIDGMDASSGHVAPNFDLENSDTDDACADDEVFAAIDQLDVSDRCRRELLRILRARTEGEAAKGAALELLRRRILQNLRMDFRRGFFRRRRAGGRFLLLHGERHQPCYL